MSIRPSWFAHSRGLVRIDGPDRLAFVQRMCSQDVRPLSAADTAVLALFLNAKGRLIDEVQVMSSDHALTLETAPHRAQALVQWLTPYTIMEDLNYTVVAEAAPCFTVLWGEDVNAHHAATTGVAQSLGFARWPEAGQVARAEPHQPSTWATHVRPALGRGVVITSPDAGQAALVADALQAAFGPSLSADAQQERLIRAGIAVAELDYPTPAPPFELRLGQDSIHWHKGCYIGQEIISRLEAYDKVARLMMGIEAAQGAEAFVAQGQTQPGTARVLVGDTVIGKLNRCVADATGLGLVGLCTIKREWAKPVAVDLVDGAGVRHAATLFDCPQWQRS